MAFQANLTNKIETEDLTQNYVDFGGYFIATEMLMSMDIFLYIMMIGVATCTIFSWFPNHYNKFIVLFYKYVSRQNIMLFGITLLILMVFAIYRIR